MHQGMRSRYRSLCLQNAQVATNPDHQLDQDTRKCFSHALLKSPESDCLYMHILFTRRKHVTHHHFNSLCVALSLIMNHAMHQNIINLYMPKLNANFRFTGRHTCHPEKLFLHATLLQRGLGEQSFCQRIFIGNIDNNSDIYAFRLMLSQVCAGQFLSLESSLL